MLERRGEASYPAYNTRGPAFKVPERKAVRMTETPIPRPYRVAALAARKPTRFDIAPSAEERAALAEWLGITAIPSLALHGELRPSGRSDWTLEASLRARVVQPCVSTLAPVETDISEPVRRRYLADLPDPEGDEVEMPEDDTTESLGADIDVGAVLCEALALALPLYPRAPGVTAEVAVEAAPPGAAPLAEETRRPFAGLADLLARKDTDQD